ncbi:MAG: hypothetical protein ABS36_00045 [Acidobacteria bacterium SCN 69-37]|nr:MAG: hypothetical protein ABS36_00045 [Acidobacteria bacterium SCN 69-37]
MIAARSLAEAFERCAARRPEAIAVHYGDQDITYGELSRSSGILARRIETILPPSQELVGLYAERGIELIIGMLAILKAGRAYVPIDPAYPMDRVRFVIRHSGVTSLLATCTAVPSLDRSQVQVVSFSRDELAAVSSQANPCSVQTGTDLAYVIYTSGSTGSPKGVMVEQRSVLRLFEQTAPLYRFGHDDVWTMLHSPGFDFSVWEIWGALLFGARLVIVPPTVGRSPLELVKLVEQRRVTVVNITPTAFRQFSRACVDRGRITSGLRLIIFGGEALTNGSLKPWIDTFGDQSPELFNMYGITETTVHVTYHRVREAELTSTDSIIGVPIADLDVLLLDDDGCPVPPGVTGCMHVGGPGVARGYLGDPELTAARFVTRRGGRPGCSRFYDSGDLAVRRHDGTLVYRGRKDDQLKIRGFRIEPREVEQPLEAHPDVVSVTVVAEDAAQNLTELVAYVELTPSDRSTSETTVILLALAAIARRGLPEFMRPTDYRLVRALPTTANGKRNRRALACFEHGRYI